MAVGVLAERPLVPARQSHAPAFPRHLERENGVTEIMPIDDQTRGTEARADKHHAQRGDAGRILQQHNVGPLTPKRSRRKSFIAWNAILISETTLGSEVANRSSARTGRGGSRWQRILGWRAMLSGKSLPAYPTRSTSAPRSASERA